LEDTLGGMLMVIGISVARGGLPCVVPSRTPGLSARRHAWSRRQRLSGKGLCRPSCGNGPPWSCSGLNTRWGPTARRRSECSSSRVRCAVGDTVGPREPCLWTTSRAGAARRILPPLGPALGKAVAWALVAETTPPRSRPALADVTARVRLGLGTPISRRPGWRMLDTDAIKAWRYTDWIVPRAPHCAAKAGPILAL